MRECIRFGKWSLIHDKCLWCGTKSIRHQGKGLCRSCYRKKWTKKPQVKERARKRRFDWYQKNKDDPEVRKRLREIAKKHIQSKKYKLYSKKANLVRSFRNFLQAKTIVKRWQNGLEILIDGVRVKTPIQNPKGQAETQLEKKMFEIKIFQEVYKKLRSLSVPYNEKEGI